MVARALSSTWSIVSNLEEQSTKDEITKSNNTILFDNFAHFLLTSTTYRPKQLVVHYISYKNAADLSTVKINNLSQQVPEAISQWPHALHTGMGIN